MDPNDPLHFRDVLGRFPTGVVLVAAMAADGSPAGMTVGSFTSVSLDPPLVAFLPAKSSTSFVKIRDAGAFCVSVLSDEQQSTCRVFSVSGGDKFAGVKWSPAPATGSPRIEGAVTWIDCEIERIDDAGDHYIVLGRVRDFGYSEDAAPLLFFQGGYGGFVSSTRTASGEHGLLRELHYVDIAAGYMRALAQESGMECLAFARRNDWQMLIGSAGSETARTWMVGRRQPHVAPLGGLFEAWSPRESVARWAGVEDVDQIPEKVDEILGRIRARGWSLGLGTAPQRDLMNAVTSVSFESPTQEDEARLRAIAKSLVHEDTEPPRALSQERLTVRSISAPVFDQDRRVALVLALFGFRDLANETITALAISVTKAAEHITGLIGGSHPPGWNPRFDL